MDKQKRIELHENMKWDSMKDIKLNCSKDLISTESGTLIMARWESDMMEHHAKVVCKRGGDILEIGFGLGISADFIQQQNIVSHTIIEPHPQIAENARRWAGNNSSIKIIESDWYDVIDELNSFDGVFYDAELDKHLYEFYPKIKSKINPKGIFTFFNPNSDGIENAHLIDTEIFYKVIKVNSFPPYQTKENQYMKDGTDKYFLPIITDFM